MNDQMRIAMEATRRENEARRAETYWTYRTDGEHVSLEEAIALGAIAATTTDDQWRQLSPGMRREIVRSARKPAQ